MEATIDMARVTTKGQITIPKAIRQAMGLREGDKVLFTSNDDGSVSMRNATATAFENARRAFEGAAEEAGLKTEEDVVQMIREYRAEKRAEQRGVQ